MTFYVSGKSVGEGGAGQRSKRDRSSYRAYSSSVHGGLGEEGGCFCSSSSRERTLILSVGAIGADGPGESGQRRDDPELLSDSKGACKALLAAVKLAHVGSLCGGVRMRGEEEQQCW